MAIDKLPSNPFNILKSYFYVMYLKINEIIDNLNGGGGLPYKLYVAIISQSGTADPVVNVMFNTIGEIVWSRVAVGIYNGTLLNAFTLNKTQVTMPVITDTNKIVICYPNSLDSVQIKTYISYPTDILNLSDEIMASAGSIIEIKVYS
jgi:hypothetical protein